MNERRFRAAVEADCAALEQDLRDLEAARGTAPGLADRAWVDPVAFAARYRMICRHLALARHRGYGADLQAHLNDLALRGHAQLYRHHEGDALGAVVRTLLVEFPRTLRAHWRSQLLALCLFVLPALGAAVTITLDPELVYHFLPYDQVHQMEAMYDPASAHYLRPRESDDDLAMFGFYIYNNIGIALRTFASGLLFGVGSAFFIGYNGLILGAVAAHLIEVGFADTFLPFVIGHGAFELTAIVLAGGTGLALGGALLSPGRHTRAQALGRAARRVVPIVYGFSAMLLIAAFIEAFWSSQHALGTTMRYAVGGGLWLSVLAFFALGGRRDGA